jgi:hypothetical protein
LLFGDGVDVVGQSGEDVVESAIARLGTPGGLARAQLRETFKAIRTAQHSIENRYHTGMLG